MSNIIYMNKKELAKEAKEVIAQYKSESYDYYDEEKLENFNTDDYVEQYSSLNELENADMSLKEKHILNYIEKNLEKIKSYPNKSYQKLALKQLRKKIDESYPYDTFGVENKFVDDIISYLSDPKVLTYNDLKGRHI